MKYGLLFLFFIGCIANAQDLEQYEPFRTHGLREHQPLLIEVKNIQVRVCSKCHVKTTEVSYDITAYAALLGLDVRNTARGPMSTPVLKNFEKTFRATFYDIEPALFPLEGLHVGTLWQECAPGAIMVNGDCRSWIVNFDLSGRVIPH